MDNDVTNPANNNADGTPFENPQTGAVVTPTAPAAPVPDMMPDPASDPAPAFIPTALPTSEPTPQPVAPLTEDPFKPDDASMKTPKQPRSSGGMGKKILWVIIIIVLLAACAFGVYTWQHKQVNSQANQLQSQSSQIQDLQAQVSKLQADAKKAAATTPSLNVIKIPELGIQITVPDSLKDLTYTISNSKLTNGQSFTSADLTTKSLLASDPACTTAKWPLGSITKVTGTYPSKPTNDIAAGQLVKQFTGYYIGNVTPQSSCSANKATQDLTISQIAAIKTALSSVTTLAN
ncbi:MAG: hypothetical protein ABI221_01730 [Candidatus Saccharimonadales bacterium]